MKNANRLLLLSLLLAGACVDDKPVVQLRHVCAPPDADSCTFSETCDAAYLGNYEFDSALAPRLTLFIEARNQLLSNDDPDVGRVDTHDAEIREAVIEFTGPVPLSPTSHRLSRVIPPNSSGVVTIYPITDATAAEIAAAALGGIADIVAHVRLRGVFGDDSAFETAAFEIPVKICSGCLPALGACPAANPILVTCPPDILTLLPLAGGQTPLSATCLAP